MSPSIQHKSELLQISELRYRRLFESARDGIVILDALTRKITDVNPFMVKLLGYSRDEFVGKELWEIGLLRDNQASAVAFRELGETGYIRYENLPLQTKDGQMRQVEFIGNAHDENGHSIIQCDIRDITERKQVEQQLRASEARKSAILETAPDCIVVIDAQVRILEWNPAAEKTFGYAREEVVGKVLPEVIIPVSLRAAHRAVMANYWANDKSLILGRRIEVMALRKNGEEFLAELAVTRIESEGTSVFTAHLRDISQRKQAEDTLQQSEARFRTAISQAPIPIMIHREDGKVLQLSKGWTEYSGYDIADIPTIHDWAGRAYGSSSEQAQQYIDELYQIQETRDDGEWTIKAKNGEERVWDFVTTPLGTFGDDQHVVISTAFDITQRKQAEGEVSWGEMRYRSLIQATTAIVWSTPASGEFETPQMGWSDFTGQDWEMYKGWGWLNAVHPDDQSETARVWDKAVESRSEYVVEHRLHRHDGEYRDMAVRAVPLLGEDGGIREWIGVHTDITERKQAEESVRASEARFQSIVANVPGVVYQFALRPDGSIEVPFVNDGCRELIDMEPAEVQRQANFFADIVHPDDRAKIERSIMESALDLTPWNWEGRFQLPSGEIKWVQGISQPQRLPDGGTLWDGLLLDVTARKQAEEERDRFFTLSLDMLCIADSNGYFKRLNPAFEATLGYSNAELMEKPFLEWVHPDDRAATLEVMQNLDEGVPTLEFVNRYRCRDGSYRWLSWVSKPFEGLFYAAAHDVTTLKKAEAALHKANDELELHVLERTAELRLSNEKLQQERQRLFDTLANVPGVVLEKWFQPDAAAGRNDFVSDQIEVMLGYSPAEWLATPDFWLSIVHPDDRGTLARNMATQFEGRDNETSEYRMTTKDGRMLWAESQVGVVRNDNGEPIGIRGVATDITARKQAEEELRRAKEDADAANLAKSEFLSRMSHELRTPLNAILGFAQLLSKQDFAPAQKERVQHILKAGRHLLDLINEVLEIARIEAGQLLLSLEPVSVRKTIQEVFALLRPLADEQGIRFQGDDSSELEVYVGADLQRLKQVLLNLCSNAVKYNRPQGTVTVTCQTFPGISSLEEPSPKDLLRINVTDTGMGMTPASRDQLFVPFMRLGAEQTTIEGTGLGLALSLSIMHAMGGTLGVESTVGVGSTFWLQLPLTPSPLSDIEEALAQAVTMEKEMVMAGAPHYTLLCIEDNLSNLRLIEAIIADEPLYNLTSAMQGQMGLDLARQHHPDLILLDLHLPDIPGDQVLAQLKSNPATADIPVVMLSAVAVKSEIQRLLAAGATAYLTKPLDIALFLNTLDNILQPPKGSQ